uniref:Tyrosine-protein kinase n=1 Tax=Rhabditophanes sp. KR3021 TaxID=114890 RepID=A0AC35TPI6_9BILA
MSTTEDHAILRQPWYHGLLTREDQPSMLKEKGDFLVRTSEPVVGNPRCYILSTMIRPETHEIKHYVIRKTSNNKFAIEKYSFNSIQNLIEHHVNTKESIAAATEVILLRAILRKAWELDHQDIQVLKKLGSGAFGDVVLCTLRRKDGTIVKGAAKTCKLASLKKEDIREVMKEARLMRKFDHLNVIKLYGVAAGIEPLMIVMELATDGALDKYLEKHEITPQKKLALCTGAAFGLEYLHSLNMIHRDIAARNCLFSENQVKIADFGLTVEGNYFKMEGSAKVPLRWLAPETIKSYYYVQRSDVWAYGIMCWEIYNNGIEPYPGMNPAEAAIKVAKDGYRMPLPDSIHPDFRYILLSKCWADAENDRYSMTEVCSLLERLTCATRPKPGPGLDFDGPVGGKGGTEPINGTRVMKNTAAQVITTGGKSTFKYKKH